jgi:hypothetical protein
MEVAGTRSWRMSEDRWPEVISIALWLRAAERIAVPADGPDGVVPGETDIDPVPPPTAAASEAAELAAGWLAWWRALVLAPPLREPVDPDRAPSELAFAGPPDFAALAQWPALRLAGVARWREAAEWNASRVRAGMNAGLMRDLRANQVVRDLERELGRPVRPFELDIVIVPVRDDQIRSLGPARYLVPERVRDGPGWPRLLRELLLPIA